MTVHSGGGTSQIALGAGLGGGIGGALLIIGGAFLIFRMRNAKRLRKENEARLYDIYHARR